MDTKISKTGRSLGDWSDVVDAWFARYFLAWVWLISAGGFVAVMLRIYLRQP